MKEKIVLGLDISTKTLGVAIVKIKEDTSNEILLLTHVTPKVNSKIKGIESLCLKKKIFENDFLKRYIDFGIDEVIIEEPLLGSNNVHTVSTLLRFNGMISDSIYTQINKVPTYISSYDARKYAFPELMAIRKLDTKGEEYDLKIILKKIEDSKKGKVDKKGKIKSNLVLFGDYPWDIDKKQVIWNKINEKYDDIQWVQNKKNELSKENFDMTDALTTVLAYNNKTIYGDYQPKIENYEVNEVGNVVNIIYQVNNVDNTLIKHKITIQK